MMNHLFDDFIGNSGNITAGTGSIYNMDWIPNGCCKDFIDLFFVVIQFGSILAVVTLYFNK